MADITTDAPTLVSATRNAVGKVALDEEVEKAIIIASRISR